MMSQNHLLYPQRKFLKAPAVKFHGTGILHSSRCASNRRGPASMTVYRPPLRENSPIAFFWPSLSLACHDSTTLVVVIWQSKGTESLDCDGEVVKPRGSFRGLSYIFSLSLTYGRVIHLSQPAPSK
jgi:hypothetical protein